MSDSLKISDENWCESEGYYIPLCEKERVTSNESDGGEVFRVQLACEGRDYTKGTTYGMLSREMIRQRQTRERGRNPRAEGRITDAGTDSTHDIPSTRSRAT